MKDKRTTHQKIMDNFSPQDRKEMLEFSALAQPLKAEIVRKHDKKYERFTILQKVSSLNYYIIIVAGTMMLTTIYFWD